VPDLTDPSKVNSDLAELCEASIST